MIILIEPQCVGWQHENVNAGFIESLKRVVGKEKVKVYAEKGHIDCLKRLLPDIEKEVYFVPINVPQKNLDYMTPFLEYSVMFQRIFEDEDNFSARAVFLLSCNKGNLVAIKKFVSRFSRMKYFVIIHAIAEQLVNNIKVPKRTVISLRMILNSFTTVRNLSFITYNPVAKDVLVDCLRKSTIEKISFLHHPFPVGISSEAKAQEDGKVHIAVWGAAARKDTKDFIESVDDEIKEQISFDTILKEQAGFNDLKSVNVIKQGGEATYSEIMQLISQSHFIFMPYTHVDYQVSASGILMNAIQQSVPILSFDTNIAVWYNQYNIGKVCRSYEEMRDFLLKLCLDHTGIWNVYKQNIVKLRSVVIRENESIIGRILSVEE